MPVGLLGYVGLCTEGRPGQRPVEVEGLRYVRPTVSWAFHPVCDQVPMISGLEKPYYGVVRILALYDEPKGGRCICWFRCGPPLIEIPWGGLIGRSCPAREFTITPEFRVGLAMAAARSGQPTELVIAEGNQIGLADGQSIYAGCKLTIENATGRIIPTAVAKQQAEADRKKRLVSSGAA